MYIGSLQLANPLILAPMAGITDLPYRLIMKSFGVSLVFTEMISANGLFFNGSATRELLKTNPAEHPRGIQLFGDDPQRIAEAIKIVETQAELIDLNLGCPVKKVVRSGAGSALLRQPIKVGNLFQAARQATKKPLTIKIRSGWDAQSINFLEICRIAEKEGIDAITLHPRTRTQMFSGQAEWGLIKCLKDNISLPIIGSGDIFTAHDTKTMFEKTGCDAVMIARGGYGNPWLIQQSLEILSNKPLSIPTIAERYEVARNHLELSLKTFGPQKTLGLMRKHFCWYSRGLNNATTFRAELNRITDIESLQTLLEEYFRNVE